MSSTLHPIIVDVDGLTPLVEGQVDLYVEWVVSALAELTGRTFHTVAPIERVEAPPGLFPETDKANANTLRDLLGQSRTDVPGQFWIGFVAGANTGGTGTTADSKWNTPPLSGTCATSYIHLRGVTAAIARRGAWDTNDPNRLEWLRRNQVRIGVHELLHTFGLIHEWPGREGETNTLQDDPRGPFRNHTASNYMEATVWNSRTWEEDDSASGGLFDFQRANIQASSVLKEATVPDVTKLEQERNVFAGAEILPPLAGELPHLRVGGIDFVDLRERYPDDISGHRTSTAAKRVVVFHHDAVAYHSTTVAADLARLAAIHRFHTEKGWGGSGYHFAISPSARYVYILGGVEESRAHVSGAARAANPDLWRGDLPNAVAIGVVWLGNFTGSRPTPAALDLYQRLVEWLPTVLDRDLTALPHKGAHPNHTVCPGDWISETSIDVFSPTEEPELDRAAVIARIDTAQAALTEARDLLVGGGDAS